jgi:amidase
VATFIERLATSGRGVTLAVKDLIDMAGMVTTAGSRAVAETASAAEVDAACLAGARAANVVIVGRTNLHEFALGATGINPWYGTPTNPLDRDRVPGGSSSGSAVAVASEEASIALGTDTGGSIRVPSACCGIAGLKTTWGRVPLSGVWPVAKSLDTVGPMARDVRGLVQGMQMLEPAFELAEPPGFRIGRLRTKAGSHDDAAVDRLLRASELSTDDVPMPTWAEAREANRVIVTAEAWEEHGSFVMAHRDGIGLDIQKRLSIVDNFSPADLAQARGTQSIWRAELAAILDRFDYLVIPTLGIYPPLIAEVDAEVTAAMLANTAPINLAGLPAVALPIPGDTHLPASLQVIGRAGSEENLLTMALYLERVAQTLKYPPRSLR